MNEQTQKLILEEIEESELTRNDPMPAGAVGVRRNRDRAQVYSLRLAPDVVRQIERIATEKDVPASSVVRGFIVAGLQARESGSETVGASVDRLSSEVERLRGLLR